MVIVMEGTVIAMEVIVEIMDIVMIRKRRRRLKIRKKRRK
jgi:hypothetical protein